MAIPGNVLNQLVNKMSWNVARSQRLSTNIANFDVPNYRRVDLKPFEQSVYTGSSNQETVLRVGEVTGGIEMSRENETLLSTENLVNYQTNLNLFKKYLGLMKTVIGKIG